jgi:peptidoglycan hydrolase-like protein with peptidoglycan-binding domain
LTSAVVTDRYGTKTEAAVKRLQQQFNTSVDGVVGPQTWNVIDALEDDCRYLTNSERQRHRLRDVAPYLAGSA